MFLCYIYLSPIIVADEFDPFCAAGTKTNVVAQTEHISISSAIQAFERLGVENESNNKARRINTTTKRRWIGPLGKSTVNGSASVQPPTADEDLIKVSILSAQEAGFYKISPSTTFLELREQIAARLGHSNFGFQDPTTRRPLSTEDRSVRGFKMPVTICQAGIDNLLADATFQESANTTMTREGAAFRVFWWDSMLSQRRLVWLRIEPHRLVVSSAGGSFKLFDAKGLRNPLVVRLKK